MIQTDYASFRNSSENNRRLIDQEEFILDVTETIAQEMEEQQLLQKDLADRLGKSKSHVSQMLGGGRNLTLRSISDIASALGCRPKILFRRVSVNKGRVVPFPRRTTAWEPEDSMNEDVRFTDLVRKPAKVCA